MADQEIDNMTVTWNSGGTTFAAQKMNVTDTASASASLLQQWQVGGADKWTVRKDGKGYLAGDLEIGGGNVIGLIDSMHGMILVPTNKTYLLVLKAEFAGTINETATKAVSGSCTATFKINSINLGGGANAVSTAANTVAHASANAFAAGDNISVTISANAACLDMSFSIKITRTS